MSLVPSINQALRCTSITMETLSGTKVSLLSRIAYQLETVTDRGQGEDNCYLDEGEVSHSGSTIPGNGSTSTYRRDVRE